MRYSELEILDLMKDQKRVDVNLIFFYLETLPDYRDAILPRHKKFITSLRYNKGDIASVKKEFDYSGEGMENIFRKIQTCLSLEYQHLMEKNRKLPMYNESKRYTLGYLDKIY